MRVILLTALLVHVGVGPLNGQLAHRWSWADTTQSAVVPNAPTPPQEPSGASIIPVVLTSFFGAGLGGLVLGHITKGDDPFDLSWASGYVAGAGVGGIVGAWAGERPLASKATLLGAVIGGIPLLLVCAPGLEEDLGLEGGIVLIGLSTLTFTGATVGNVIGARNSD